MKKHSAYLMMATVVTVMVFVACKKDPEPLPSTPDISVITAQNIIGGNENITVVKALMVYDNSDEWGADVIAASEYKNRGFVLTLPKILPDKYLFEIDNEDLFVSDPKAKMGSPEILAFDNEENEVGYFYLWGINISMGMYVEAGYYYADRDFTIKGKIDYDYYSETWDASFKKGWNILYWIEDIESDELFTTKKPSGITLRWVYDGSWDWSHSMKSSKNINSLKKHRSKASKEKNISIEKSKADVK